MRAVGRGWIGRVSMRGTVSFRDTDSPGCRTSRAHIIRILEPPLRGVDRTLRPSPDRPAPGMHSHRASPGPLRDPGRPCRRTKDPRPTTGWEPGSIVCSLGKNDPARSRSTSRPNRWPRSQAYPLFRGRHLPSDRPGAEVSRATLVIGPLESSGSLSLHAGVDASGSHLHTAMAPARAVAALHNDVPAVSRDRGITSPAVLADKGPGAVIENPTFERDPALDGVDLRSTKVRFRRTDGSVERIERTVPDERMLTHRPAETGRAPREPPSRTGPRCPEHRSP
jgi:hypothetical protein